MGLAHIPPATAVNLIHLNEKFPGESTFALVKTESIEIIRMFLAAGKKIPDHSVPGEITVQCLSGKLNFAVEGKPIELSSGDWLFLSGNQPHSLDALTDCILLVTIMLTPRNKV